MLSLHVHQVGSDLFLMERDYPAQGVSPSYTNLCRISHDEAATLIKSKLVTPWLGAEVNGEAGDPAEFLTLDEGAYRFAVRLDLPQSDIRKKAISIEVPGHEHIMDTLKHERDKIAIFLSNTQIGSTVAAEPIAS